MGYCYFRTTWVWIGKYACEDFRKPDPPCVHAMSATISGVWFHPQLKKEANGTAAQEANRVDALWDKAEEHAVRKQGDMSLAWQTVQGVSEKHLYNFHDRHRIRVRFLVFRFPLHTRQ